MIYVYAITDGAAHVDGELRCLSHGPLAAVYGLQAPGAGEATEEALWQHERVVEELMAERAVLPLRFGSKVADEYALRSLLAARAGEFRAALDRVRGAVELGVRATVCGLAEVSVPASGREYVAAKLTRRRQATTLAEKLQMELAPRAREARYRTGTDPRPEFAGAYLVERTRVDDFFTHARDVAGRLAPDAELACTGPWPPYSFTEPA